MPDVYLGTVKPGDLFLLASDGLTGMLRDPSWRSSWRKPDAAGGRWTI